MNTTKQGEMPTREMNAKHELIGSAMEPETATQKMEPEMVAYLEEQRSRAVAQEAPKPGEMPTRGMND